MIYLLYSPQRLLQRVTLKKKGTNSLSYLINFIMIYVRMNVSNMLVVIHYRTCLRTDTNKCVGYVYRHMCLRSREGATIQLLGGGGG